VNAKQPRLSVLPNATWKAAQKLAEELQRRPGLVVKTGAAITFEALEVHGGHLPVAVPSPRTR
jgi:F420-0:gamma-glutamyl ligase-like protein